MFDQIRELLTTHGTSQRFGLTLLHQHFDTGEDEALLERINRENRTLTLRPARVTDPCRSAEISWRLDDPSVESGAKRCADAYRKRTVVGTIETNILRDDELS